MERKDLLDRLNEIIVELDERKRTKWNAEISKSTYFEELGNILIVIEQDAHNIAGKRTDAQREFDIKSGKYSSKAYKDKLKDIQNISDQIKLLDIEIETLEMRFKAYKISYGSDLL